MSAIFRPFSSNMYFAGVCKMAIKPLTCSSTSLQTSSPVPLWTAARPCPSYPAGSWCGPSGTCPRHLGAPGLLTPWSLGRAPRPAPAACWSRRPGLAGREGCSAGPAGGWCTARGASPASSGLCPRADGLRWWGAERLLNLLPPWLHCVRSDVGRRQPQMSACGGCGPTVSTRHDRWVFACANVYEQIFKPAPVCEWLSWCLLWVLLVSTMIWNPDISTPPHSSVQQLSLLKTALLSPVWDGMSYSSISEMLHVSSQSSHVSSCQSACSSSLCQIFRKTQNKKRYVTQKPDIHNNPTQKADLDTEN